MKAKLKVKHRKNKQEQKTAVKASRKISREETQQSSDVYGLQTSGSSWLQKIYNQLLKETV